MAKNSTSLPRDGFKSTWGFVMAAVGSAVGMANVWAFPYRTAMYGGAAYLIPYLICVVILARTGIVGEIAFGRWGKTGPVGTMSKAMQKAGVKNKALQKIGVLPVLASFAIATGYAIIMGWVIRYLVGAITGAVVQTADVGGYFGAICGNLGSIGWHALALVVTLLMMVGGIAKSVEKINKFMIPAFFVLFLGMTVYMFFVPGSAEGYKYLFIPKWEFLLDPKTWIYALGQAFFSLSLAGNGTLIYGSYFSRKEDVVSASRNIALFDTIAAVLAACVVIPAVFAFGMDPAAGPPLMFITLPAIFQAMGPVGWAFSIIFFAAIFFAAASSIVNLFECPIEMMQAEFKLPRWLAVTIIMAVSFGVGIFLENGDIIGSWMDIMSIYLCPLGALIAGILFFWVLGKKGFAKEEIQAGRNKAVGKGILIAGKYLYCGIAALVIVLGIVLGGIG